MRRRDYELIADIIRSHPDRSAMSKHFADEFARRKPQHFNRDRFLQRIFPLQGVVIKPSSIERNSFKPTGAKQC